MESTKKNETENYSCYLQAWNFRPGGNFVLDMQEALVNSERFIAVLSGDYMESMYCQAEWAAAFTKDPNSEKRLFIPVRIADIKPKGLLAAFNYIDLFNKGEEEAKRRLLNAVNAEYIQRKILKYPSEVQVEFPLNVTSTNDFSSAILEQYHSEKSNYCSFCKKMEYLLDELLKQHNITYHSITSRTKELKSLEDKLIIKNKKYTCIQEITDIVGIRIITYYNDQVDIIADLLEHEFLVDKKNTIDKRKITDPDRFGYLSLHYIVQFNNSRIKLPEYSNFKDYKAEIQIRTILQHTWAEIEHDLGYKSKEAIPLTVRRDFYRLAGLLELADKEFLNIKNQLRSKEKGRDQFIELIAEMSPNELNEYKQINKSSADHLDFSVGGKNNESK